MSLFDMWSGAQRSRRFVIALASVVFVLLPLGAGAQFFVPKGPRPDLPPPSGSPPDLTGTWSSIALRANMNRTITEPIPFQPWAKEINDKAIADQLALVTHLDDSAYCKPMGPLDMFWPPAYSIRFFQTEGKILLLEEMNHERREIFMNTEHPADLKPSYFGHSVGHWEGNTLVVDTIGFNDKTAILTFPVGQYFPRDIRRNVRHTEQLHVVERWSLTDGGKTLLNEVTIDDPGAFTAPWNMTFPFEWRPDLRHVDDECNEDNQSVAEIVQQERARQPQP